jgi:hypothetical protein
MAGILAANRPLPADATHLSQLRGFLERELDAALGARSTAAAAGAPRRLGAVS